MPEDIRKSGLTGQSEQESLSFRLGNVQIDMSGKVTTDDLGSAIGYSASVDSHLVKQKFRKLYDLKDGVTDVAVAYGALMVFFPFLKEEKRYPFFALQLRGRHGSFKTQLARKVVIHLPDNSQEIHFYDKSDINSFNSVKKHNDLFTIHVDDILSAKNYIKKKNYADLYEIIVRASDRQSYSSGTILTAEKIPDEVAASAYDRVWDVPMPAFTPEDKKKWFAVISSIEDSEISTFYVDLVKELLLHYADVTADITTFFDKIPFSEELRDTRMYDHLCFIAFSKFMLEKYYFGITEDMDKFWGKCSLLVERAFEQQEVITEMDVDEADIDYRMVVSEIFFKGGSPFYPFKDKNKYNALQDNERKAFFYDDRYLYILPDELAEEVLIKTGKSVTIKMLGKELDKCKFRVPTDGESKNVSGFNRGRHMRLSLDRVLQFYKKTHSQDPKDLQVQEQ